MMLENDPKMAKYKPEVTPSVSKLGRTTMALYPIFKKNENEVKYDEEGKPIKWKKHKRSSSQESQSSEDSYDK